MNTNYQPAILVTSHPNTEEKEYICAGFGNFISQYKIPNYLFTNYPASKYTQEQYLGAYFHNYNPKGPYIGSVYRKYPNLGFINWRNINDWGYSGVKLFIQGIETLKGLGYSHIYIFLYDIEQNYPKIKNYINFCKEKFIEGKKAVFFEYPYPLKTEDIKGIKTEIFEETIDTCIFSGEVNFLLEFLNKIATDYSDSKLKKLNPDAVLEHFFYYYLKEYFDEIYIFPRENSFKTIFQSSKIDTIENYKIYSGISNSDGKIIVVIEGLLDNIKIKVNNNFINLESDKKDNLNIIKLDIFENSDYILNYSYNGVEKEYKLFDTNNTWIVNNYWTKI